MLLVVIPTKAGIQKVNGHVLFLDLVLTSLDPRLRGDDGKEKAGMAEERVGMMVAKRTRTNDRR